MAQDFWTFSQQIVATVREPLLVLTPNLRVALANAAFYRTFQVAPKDTEQQYLFELGNGQWASPELRHLLEDILPQHSVFADYEVAHHFPTIGHRVILLNARQLEVGAHGTAFILLAMEDITERKRLEEERARLRALEAAAHEEVEQLRQLFLSAVSHELLTPLAIIQGHAQLLNDPSTRAAPLLADNALEAIREETHRLHRLITTLLTTTRAQAGALDIKPVPLALGPLVTRAVQHFQGRTRRHQLQTKVPAAVPLILGDRDSLESVVYNLLDNAYKYSPQGGVIGVEIAVHDATVGLTVHDHGLGIDPDAQQHIFEPHYRAAAHRSRGIPGTGLGLYLCAAVIWAHQGRIWAESTPGQGSVFHVTLPRADAETAG